MIQAVHKGIEIEMELHQLPHGNWKCDYTLIKHPGRIQTLHHGDKEFQPWMPPGIMRCKRRVTPYTEPETRTQRWPKVRPAIKEPTILLACLPCHSERSEESLRLSFLRLSFLRLFRPPRDSGGHSALFSP